jgi:hypothetical protein
MDLEKTEKKLCILVGGSCHLVRWDGSVRLKRVVDFSWWHDYQGVFDVKFAILDFLLQPDLMETLAADAAAQMSVDLELVRLWQMVREVPTVPRFWVAPW